MKRLRFTEEQILGVLKEGETGAKTGDLARRHGVSEATIYNWKIRRPGGTPRTYGCKPAAANIMLLFIDFRM